MGGGGRVGRSGSAAQCGIAATRSHFITDGAVDPPITFHREPPLSRAVLVMSTLIFGANEFAARAPELLFLLGAVCFLYRLGTLYRSPRVALVSAFVFGLLPPVFYYTHTAYLEGGLLFFAIAASFYFLKHLKNGDRGDLLFGALLTSAGFLYKRPGLLAAFFFGVYLFLLVATGRRGMARSLMLDYVKVGWLILVGVLPWLLLVGVFAGPGRFMRSSYELSLSNWFSPNLASQFLQQMPLQLSWPIAVVTLLSLIFAVLRRRDSLFAYTLVWFAVSYAFFTSDGCTACVGYDRFALIWLPAVAIWIGDSADGLAELIPLHWSSVGVSAILIVYVGLASTVLRISPLGPKYASYIDAAGVVPPVENASEYWRQNVNSYDIGTAHLPVGQVFEHFKSAPGTAGKIMTWDIQQMEFYAFKHELDLQTYVCRNRCMFDTKAQLIDFSRKNEVTHILVAAGRDYIGTSLWAQYLGPDLGQEFEDGEFEPLELVERFDHGDQTLLLIRIPEAGSQ